MGDKVVEPWLARLPADEQAPAAHIAGNATSEIKQLVANVHQLLMAEGSGFGELVGRNIVIRSVDINLALGEAIADLGLKSKKYTSNVVCDILVDEAMINKKGTLHSACASYLIATCTSFPMVALSRAQGSTGDFGVTQSLDTMFHAPTKSGCMLRIISRSLSAGQRTLSAKLEAWDITNDRLVFTGTHLKLLPVPAKL